MRPDDARRGQPKGEIEMNLPASTGAVAAKLGVHEPRLNELIRRGRIRPEPPIVAGRRLWHRYHVLRAAEVLGVLTDELQLALEPDINHSGAS
jgi:hypothetical protein